MPVARKRTGQAADVPLDVRRTKTLLKTGALQSAILVVTAKAITAADRYKLNGFVAAIMGKAEFSGDRLTTEVRRAMSGRTLVA